MAQPTNGIERFKRKEFSYEIATIYFPSERKVTFRASVASNADAVVIWLEHKKSKQQWQASIIDVAAAGDGGSLPEEVIMESLKRALAALGAPAAADVAEKLDPDAPTVDINITGGKATLLLSLSLMGGIWKNTYHFSLSPVKLEKLDVLEAKLRDAEEEIIGLRKELQVCKTTRKRPALLSLSSGTATPHMHMVVWQGQIPRVITASHFDLSADCKQVKVLRAGLYQVQVRLGQTNSSNTESLGLQLNGVDVAKCIQSDANGHQNTPQIFEILELRANDVLQVRCGANSHSLGNEFACRFTILFLGE